MVVGALASFGTVEIIKQIKFCKWLAVLVFSLILFLGFYARMGQIVFSYKIFTNKNNDTGLIIGEWLKDNYDEHSVIWKDVKHFYIPPRFKNVYYFSRKNRITGAEEINKVNPDILILTSLSTVAKINELSIAGTLPKYRQLEYADYSNRQEDYKDIYVLARQQ